MVLGGSSSNRSGAPALSVAVGQRPALLLDAVSRELCEAGFEICCAATSVRRLTRAIGRGPPDLALVHAGLDPVVPLGFVGALRDAAPGMPIVVMIDEPSPCLARMSLDEEVDGVVLGDSSVCELVHVLEQVAAGEAVFPAGWVRTAHRADGESIAARLSNRQRDVLELLAAGMDNGRIAEHLHISPNTVKFHIRLIYERLGVTNRVQAALLAENERVSAGDHHAVLTT